MDAISLSDYRDAKVARVKCSRPRALSDQAEQNLQASLKSTEKPATREERVFFAIALCGCAWLVIALGAHLCAALFR
jgi:hypothetical protein